MEERIKKLEFDLKNLIDFLDNQAIEMHETKKDIYTNLQTNSITVLDILTKLKTFGENLMELQKEIEELKNK